MADNVTFQSSTLATPASGVVVATDDAGAGGHVQLFKLAIATNGSVTLVPADATDGLLVNLGSNNDVTVTSGTVTVNALPAGTNNIGDVDVASVPTDPFGANADAASATGSISAKLRFIASTGIPVTGTVTVASHAVTNAGTFAVQAAQSGTWTVQPGNTANTTAWKVDGSAVTQPVSYATTGSGTATGALRVELPTNGTGVIATVGAVTAITNALPAGTNAIGKLSTNTGVTIGAVEIAAAQTLATVTTVGTVSAVSAVTPGTGAANLGKAEDAAHSSGDTGVMVLAVRSDAGATLAGTDGDYIPLTTNSAGALYVTGGGGGTQYVEDAAAAADPTGTVPILVRKDTPAATVSTDGDNIAQRGSNFGAAYVTLLDGSGNVVAPGGGTQYAEDGAQAGGEQLTLAGAVRRDAAASSSGTDGDYSTINTDASGRLWVNNSGVTQPVSGTITANMGTVTADPFGANADAASATGSISAKLRFIAATGIPITGTVTVASHAVTNAGTFAVQATEADGANVTLGAKADAKSTATDTTAVTIMSVLKQVSASVQAPPSQAVTNAGTFATQVDGSALTALQKIDDPVLVDDAAFTPATSSVSMAGFQADETATDSVDEGDAGAARMTLDRKLIVTVQPHTAGGWLIANMTTGDTFTALTNSAQAIKATAGKLGGWYIYNPNATAAYVNIYNIAFGSVTVGTSTPAMNIVIPATSAANLELVNGITFGTAMSASATTTGGGNTAPGTALEANFWYL